jgi:hypothetical protein
MNVLYRRITLITTVIMMVAGTLLLRRPIVQTNIQTQAWISWGVVVLTSVLTIFGSKFSTAIQGLDRIATLKRWDILRSFGEILTLGLILLISGNLLTLVIASQIWKVIGVGFNYFLCRNEQEGVYSNHKDWDLDSEIFQSVWPSAWRSGVGRFMSYGLTQASGLIFAQVGVSQDVATYLISLRLIQTVVDFSRAPFYSKLPKMANLFAQNKQEELIILAKRGMILAYWTFVAGFVVFGLIGAPLLNLIGSNAPFASSMLWIVLGIGFFIERYGAMHIQLYSTTNRINWHIANGVTGTLYLVTSMLLLGTVGILAFPLAQIISNLGFYAWFSAYYSYRTFKMNFWKFEAQTSLSPITVLVSFSLYSLFMVG